MNAIVNDKPVTILDFQKSRAQQRKLTVVTAYDYTSAKLVDGAGTDCILVGDSLGMVIQGHSTSLPVTLDEMIYHTKCVMRGVSRSFVVADMPFMTYQLSPQQALETAGRLVKEGGAHAVKLEGGARVADAIRLIVEAGIPVMGHVGMTPQSVNAYGGFRVQKNKEQILADAQAVTEAGAFSVVVECVPGSIGQAVTAAITIPTIGIGAGPHCDGQVLVYHDLLGLFSDFKPSFVKQYGALGEQIRAAIHQYGEEVRQGIFPGLEHTFKG